MLIALTALALLAALIGNLHLAKLSGEQNARAALQPDD